MAVRVWDVWKVRGVCVCRLDRVLLKADCGGEGGNLSSEVRLEEKRNPKDIYEFYISNQRMRSLRLTRHYVVSINLNHYSNSHTVNKLNIPIV